LEKATPASGFVPRLLTIERLDERVSVASYEYVQGRVGNSLDTQECLRLYAELQTATLRRSHRAAQAVLDACRSEAATWTEELINLWDPVHWTDPKILKWAGADAPGLTAIGIPALRSVPGLLAEVPHDDVCSPVHADLYVGNYLRTPAGQFFVFDWDEGYWGLPGMGLQILLREAMDAGREDLTYENVLKYAPQLAEAGLSEYDLAVRTLAGAVIEMAVIRTSLREMGRPRERHAAYLAAWACRYHWAIKMASSAADA
jgi:thiamine kinase-like enzyme